MKKYGDCRHPGPVMALLLACMPGCSDDSESDAGTGGTAGAGGSISAGGGTGGSLAAGGSGGSSGATAGPAGGSAGTGGSGGAAGSGATVSLDAGAGLGGSAATDSGSNVQRCEAGRACLEFRGHDPACQETNVFNCSNALNGSYSQGPCAADYEFVEVEETFCGPTASFLRPAP